MTARPTELARRPLLSADGQRFTAWATLGLCLTLSILRRGDGWGGDSVDYIASARDLSAESRLPPGLPLLLAPFTGSMFTMRLLMLAASLALIVCMWLAAMKLGGWRSAAVAGGLMLASPFLTGGSPIMSDSLGALLIVGALLALLHGRDRLAAVLAGLSAWTRLVHVVFAVALPRRVWPVAGAVIGALVAWQLLVKDSLLGYSSEQASWAPGHIFGHGVWYELGGNPAPEANVVYFPAVLLGLHGSLIFPGAALVGVWGMLRHGGDAARFAGLTVLATVAVYLPYYFQSARFMLPACAVLTVYAASAVTGVLDRDPVEHDIEQPVRGVGP